MSTQIIEQIRETFDFQSNAQYSDFNEMANDFLAKELLMELNATEN